MQARLVTPSRAYYLTTATMPAPFKRISDIEDMDEDEWCGRAPAFGGSRGAVAYVGDDVYYLAVGNGMVWVAA